MNYAPTEKELDRISFQISCDRAIRAGVQIGHIKSARPSAPPLERAKWSVSHSPPTTLYKIGLFCQSVGGISYGLYRSGKTIFQACWLS